MHASPAEQILSNAEISLDKQRMSVENKREARERVAGNIDAAIRQLPKHTELPAYMNADGMNLDVSVRSTGRDSQFGKRGTYQLFISGQLTAANGQKTEPFDMYRLGRKVPNSDTMGDLPETYEVSVADPKSKDGFTPLALANMGLYRGKQRHTGSFFGSKIEVTDAQEAALANSGFFVDPRGVEMIGEAHHILDLAMAQNASVTPISPEVAA